MGYGILGVVPDDASIHSQAIGNFSAPGIAMGESLEDADILGVAP
jgi:hypothetical protein